MKVHIGKSKIHGNGIFANKNIRKGEIVGIIKGKRHFYVIDNVHESKGFPDWVGYKKNYWIDPLPPFKFLNHSCDANTGLSGEVTLRAIRDIRKDEEITMDYSITEIDRLWQMKCFCGSQNCRKIVKSIEFLPERVFNRYNPYVPTAFKKFYLRSNTRA